jgi:hypothetical protein
MIRLYVLLVSLYLVGLVAAQDVPKPVVPKADGKATEPKKDAPNPDPKQSGEDVDVHKTAERIAENAQRAGDRLKEKDSGEDTQKIQQEIVKDIDALIKKAQQPPPMSSDMNPMPMTPPPMGGAEQKSPMGGGGSGGGQSKSPMGGMGGLSQPKAGGGGGASGGSDAKSGRRQRRDRQPRGDRPMGMGEPMANAGTGGMNPVPASPEPKDGQMGKNDRPTGDGGGDRFGKMSPKRKDEKFADLYKDVWGHLPDRLRQEMDLYYREKFMPRYSELLRQYYAALAEQKKSGKEDR